MDRIAAAGSFLAALKQTPIDRTLVAGLLRPDVVLESTSGNSSGLEAVVQRFVDDPAGRLFREAVWRPLEEHGGAVKAVGEAAQGVILVFHFEGEQIGRVQHQFFTVRGAAAPVHLTQEMKQIINNSLADRHPIVVAYVDERGAPQLSFRGSVQAFSDTQIAVWVRPESRLVECVEKNAYVSFLYRNEDTHAGFNIQGRGRISREPEECRRVYESSPAIERERDLARLGVALIVDIDLMEGSIVRLRRESERVRMARNEG
jgi:hypothetical protein